MLRSEIIQGFREVYNAIQQSGLQQVPMRPGKPADPQAREFLLHVMQNYSLLAAQYSSAARKVSEKFGLDIFLDVKLWGELLDGQEKLTVEFMTVYRNLQFIQTATPFLIDLLVQKPEIRSTYNEKEVLHLILPEQKNQLSHVERVVDAMESIGVFYKVLSDLEHGTQQSLSVVSCDSGSDKSFKLAGTASVIIRLKGLLLEIRDLSIPTRELPVRNKAELILSSLSVADSIAEQESTANLGPEKAEILRRDFSKALVKYLSTGAIIPEMEAVQFANPRQLMATDPKLLTATVSDNSTKVSRVRKNVKKHRKTKRK